MSICQSVDSNDKEWLELCTRLQNTNTFQNPSAEVQKASLVTMLENAKKLLKQTRNDGKLKHALCAEIYVDFALVALNSMCKFHEETNTDISSKESI